MFGIKSNKKNQEGIENSARNHFAHGTTVTGAIDANGVVRIDGVVEGTIKSKGKVAIGDQGKVIGDIVCQDAEIEGKLIGNIEVKGLLYLKQTAHLEGDFIAQELKTDPGAIFNGHGSTTKNGTNTQQHPAIGNSKKQGEKAAQKAG